MFLGFWSWVLVLAVVIAVFSADRLPEWRQQLSTLTKDGVQAAKKGAKAAQEKIEKMKAEQAKKAEQKKKEKEDSDD